MSASLERLARNQALFREVNERIEATAGDNAKIEFVCECSDTACIETLELRLPAYEQIRANPLRFVIKPGHEIDAIERVISENGGYAVVEKHKAEDDLIEMDPRTGAASQVDSDAIDPREALEALRSMRASWKANPDCPAAVLEAITSLIAEYERKAA